jgi:hypothetical protein
VEEFSVLKNYENPTFLLKGVNTMWRISVTRMSSQITGPFV